MVVHLMRRRILAAQRPVAPGGGPEQDRGWSVFRPWDGASQSLRRWRPYDVCRSGGGDAARPTGTTGEPASGMPTAARRAVDDEDPGLRRMRLEAILLLAKSPLSTRKLAQLAHLADGTEARTLVRHLNRCYDELGRAMRVEQVAGGFRLLTRPAYASWLARLGHLPPAVRLSSPMMETLAVIAYRQPASRADIEAVRGVGCGELLRQLMERDLVRIAGRSEELGRPYLYGTTKRFLQLFGLASVESLPPIRWQLFQSEIEARETDEPTDSIPSDSTTSTKESVVSTAVASVSSETDPSLSTRFDLQPAGSGGSFHPVVPQAAEEDDLEDLEDEDDDDEEEDDFEDDEFDSDWDDDDEDDDVDDEDDEDEEEVDEWEEVDDADTDADDEEDDADDEDVDDEDDVDEVDDAEDEEWDDEEDDEESWDEEEEDEEEWD